MSEWKPKGAAAKLAYIQSQMANVAKTGRHAQGYGYIQEHKVIEQIRPFLRDLHCAVVVEPACGLEVREATVYGKPGFLTTLRGRIRFIDSDEPAGSPDREIVAEVAGQGADREDKGSGKAQTYLTKYAMQKLFLIPTEQIDDSDDSPPADAPTTTPRPAKDDASGASVRAWARGAEKRIVQLKLQDDIREKLKNIGVDVPKPEPVSPVLRKLTSEQRTEVEGWLNIMAQAEMPAEEAPDG